jgi:4-amino-4-deoxy-L-arabinose transferase-like glycosyltransferase
VTPINNPYTAAARRWSPRSVLLLVLAWIALQFTGLFAPGLLDDVDSVYIEVAREMMLRHDYVTPFANGVRFFDKPPLMYWMAAGGMRVFGMHDWAARLPLALCVLLLALAVYALGIRFFDERGGFYSALAISTSIGTYLYTRFYIPDILLALWMTLGAHLLLSALDAVHGPRATHRRRALLCCWSLAAVMALNVLTKGIIGLVFPLALVFLYLLLTRQLRLLTRLHPFSSSLIFLLIAAPWHILAALRNPPIAMPAGNGLPARAGWAWFYLYNEHIARFRGLRIPHDYGQVPLWLFWILLGVWLMPWVAFLPGALRRCWRDARPSLTPTPRHREAALLLLCWALLVLGFFSFSSRQEYYSLPALPALALMAGGYLSMAEQHDGPARRSVLFAHKWFLVPLCTFIAIICGYFAIAAPKPPPGADVASLLTSNPAMYNLSLGHMFDLTGRAMGLFRGPLAGTAISMLGVGLLSYRLRRRHFDYAANLTLAVAMCGVLLSAHEGLARFYPTLGSKPLAQAINRVIRPQDLIILDGEYTSGSSLNFYTRHQLHFVNGRVNGMWFGSFWPDAPAIFDDEVSLHTEWAGPQRIFLLTYDAPKRAADLAPYGPVSTLANSGGKSILTNRPLSF